MNGDIEYMPAMEFYSATSRKVTKADIQHDLEVMNEAILAFQEKNNIETYPEASQEFLKTDRGKRMWEVFHERRLKYERAKHKVKII